MIVGVVTDFDKIARSATVPYIRKSTMFARTVSVLQRYNVEERTTLSFV